MADLRPLVERWIREWWANEGQRTVQGLIRGGRLSGPSLSGTIPVASLPASVVQTTDAASTVVSETSAGQSPAVGTSTNYAREDHTHGTPSGGGGGDVATDALWDAKGDLAVGTGADTAAKLTAGSDGKVLTTDSAQTTGLKWATPVTVATDTLWDAKGDLAAGTGADTASKLTVGSNGQMLTAQSAQATGLQWVDDIKGLTVYFPTLTTGVKLDWEAPFAGTITAWRIVSDATLSIVVDVWKDTYANFPPTVADTITASAKPTLSSTTKNQDTTLTGWTVSFAKGDWLRFNIDSVTPGSATYAALSLGLKRTS